MNPASQLQAAMRQHESTCDCCGHDGIDTEAGAARVAASLVKADEVAELIEGLYENAHVILRALSAIPFPSYAHTSMAKRIREIVKQVELS